MSKGLIVSNVSNIYEVEDSKSSNIIKCIPRGKFKKEEITPVVGDKVEIQILDEENKKVFLNGVHF